jgi:hypothetical protein
MLQSCGFNGTKCQGDKVKCLAIQSSSYFCSEHAHQRVRLTVITLESMVYEPHSSSEELEAYSLGLSPDANLERVEEHLLICERCQDELALTDRFSRVSSETAKRLRSIHITEDGPIFGAMHRGADGKWIARHWGRQLDGGQVCDSVDEANAYLTESFRQMFPEHLCSGQCWG